jgi:hypothetical protein
MTGGARRFPGGPDGERRAKFPHALKKIGGGLNVTARVHHFFECSQPILIGRGHFIRWQ